MTDETQSSHLAAATVRVLAVADSRDPVAAPAVDATAPLGPPPEYLRTKVATRVAAGLSETGPDSPSAGIVRRVVLPSAGLAVLDAIGLVAALANGSTSLVVVTIVLLVIFTVLSVLGTLGATRDPLRFTADDRRVLEASAQWRSRQPWLASTLGSKQCALVVAAADAAERAAGQPVWLSLALDRHRVRVDVTGELDRIDAEAFAMSADLDDSSPRWNVLVEQVAAFTCYADELAHLPVPQGEPVAVDADRRATLAGYLEVLRGAAGATEP